MITELLKFLLVDHQKATKAAISGIQFANQIRKEQEDAEYHEQHLSEQEKIERKIKSQYISKVKTRVRPIIIREILSCALNKAYISESTHMSNAGVDLSKLKNRLKINHIHYDVIGIHTTWKWGSTISEYADFICNYHANEECRLKDINS